MSEFTLKNRVEGGGSRELSDWGMNSEYGVSTSTPGFWYDEFKAG